MWLVPVAAVLLLVWLAGREVKPAAADDFSDLRIERREIPDEKNFWVLLEDVVGLLPAHARTSEVWRAAGNTWVGEEQKRAVLAESEAARERLKAQLPRCGGYAGQGFELKDWKSSYEFLLGVQNLNRALSAEFFDALARNDDLAARESVATAFRCAELLIDAPGDDGTWDFLSGFLRGALWRCERLLHSRACPDEWLSEWAARLPREETVRSAGIRTVKGQSCNLLAEIDDGSLRRELLGAACSGDDHREAVKLFLLRSGYRTYATKRRVADVCRESVSVLESGRAPVGFFDRQNGDEPDMIEALKPNTGGKIIADYQSDQVHRVVVNVKQLETSVACLRALLACERFRRRHGAYPETLDALVPEFLEAVPRDTFSGGPLLYSRKKELLWSVGENLCDDGGSSARKNGEDGWSRQARTKYAMDMVYPVSSNVFEQVNEQLRKREEKVRRPRP